MCDRNVDDIGMLIRMLDNSLRRNAEQSMAKSDMPNLSMTNGWLLTWLDGREKEGLVTYQRDLESSFGITRSAISRSLKILEDKHMIVRLGVAGDARKKQIVLTDAAKAIAARMEADGRKTEARLTGGFTPEEQNELRTYIRRLLQNMEGEKTQ